MNIFYRIPSTYIDYCHLFISDVICQSKSLFTDVNCTLKCFIPFIKM